MRSRVARAPPLSSTRDFADLDTYRSFVDEIVGRRNAKKVEGARPRERDREILGISEPIEDAEHAQAELASDLSEAFAEVVRTMCPMNCHPTFCGMLVEVEGGRLKSVSGDKDNPDSQGFLCVRGRSTNEIFGNSKRLLYPQIRDDRRSNTWRHVSWGEALDFIVTRMRKVGPHVRVVGQRKGSDRDSVCEPRLPRASCVSSGLAEAPKLRTGTVPCRSPRAT